MRALARPSGTTLVDRVPPHAFFMVSAVFHYLGPSFAVLLFSHVGVLGVAWLRIASAAAIFAIWRRPWRVLIHNDWRVRILILGLGVTLALMNSAFYLAIDRMPLATVASKGYRLDTSSPNGAMARSRSCSRCAGWRRFL